VTVELAHIQGNVFAGFNKDHQAFVFMRLPRDRKSARAWLSSVVADVAAHTDVAAFNALYKKLRKQQETPPELTLKSVWMNLAFTPSGLTRLGRNGEIGSSSAAFREGLARRAAQIGHAGSSAPRHWLAPFRRAGAIDAVMIVAGDDVSDVEARCHAYATGLSGFGGSVVLRLDGNTRVDLPGHEHFGFKDGVSQPGVRGVTVPQDPRDPDHGIPGQDLLWPGEFVVGYPRQSRNPNRPDEPGPLAAARPAWTKNGSFLAFQRLVQDVKAFGDHVNHLASTHGMNRDLLAASLVGRHVSGCPLEVLNGLGDVGQTLADVGPSDPRVLSDAHINDFEYRGPDAAGDIVPRSAHIRKAYPRDEYPPGEIATQRRRMLRRGIAFGSPYRSGARRGSPSHGDSERGLLFACYQSSIQDQFEFVQASFARSDFPNPGDGVDPILNEQRHATTIVRRANPPQLSLQPFVRMTGGAYFFAPSIPALRMLARVP
jgi:Dyp-type peroxidase family